MGFPEDTNETLQNSYDMMNELELDKNGCSTLMPFPGTSLFKQVVKDKLFVKKINYDEIWKNPISMNQDEFLIKPYNMSLDDLQKWRKKFDQLITKYWINSYLPKPIPGKYSDKRTGMAPRIIYN